MKAMIFTCSAGNLVDHHIIIVVVTGRDVHVPARLIDVKNNCGDVPSPPLRDHDIAFAGRRSDGISLHDRIVCLVFAYEITETSPVFCVMGDTAHDAFSKRVHVHASTYSGHTMQ
jgi:hypothetical protein